MTIRELKTQIESGAVTHDLIILKDTENSFLSTQYIDAIAKANNLKLNYIDDISSLLAESNSLFGPAESVNSAQLNVVKSDVFIWVDKAIASLKDVIVVVHRFDNDTLEKEYEKYIVSIPNIERWMILDYVYSIVPGVDQRALEWLIDLCGTNYYRLQQEIDKVLLFREDERKYLFEGMIQDGAVEDLSTNTILDFTSAIMSRDLPKLQAVYREINRIDVDGPYLLSILLSNFKSYVTVRLTSNPTPETTGFDSKRIYAVTMASRCYSTTQILNIYEFLLEVDRRLKTGEIPDSVVVDYITTKVLSM